MDPIVIHYQSSNEIEPGFVHGLVSESGSIPLRTWAVGEHEYAVIAEPTRATLEVLVQEIRLDLIGVARLEVGGLSTAEIGDMLPVSLEQQIQFPMGAGVSPEMALGGEGKSLVRCHCVLGIHPAPACAAEAGSGAPAVASI